MPLASVPSVPCVDSRHISIQQWDKSSECCDDVHVHKEKTDQLSVVELANSITNTEHRMSIFGTFSEEDL